MRKLPKKKKRKKRQKVQRWDDVSENEATVALKIANSWKSPDTDKLPNFSRKNLKTMHGDGVKSHSTLMKDPTKCPEGLA